MSPVSGPAGVMALVLAETAAGGVWLLFLTPLWGEVKRGFFYLTGAILVVIAASAGGAARAGYVAASGSAGRAAAALSFALAAATAIWLVLLALKARLPARIVGLLSVPVAVGMLAAFAGTADEPALVSFFQLLAGAAFTGAVLDGLLLGHWYLVDRGLSRGPINRMAWLLIGAVALEGIAVMLGGFGPSSRPGPGIRGTLSPFLSLAGIASWIALGMVAITGMIAVFVRLTLKGTRPSAVQAATGFFYLAVITAFTGELAAKVKFLP